MRAPPLVVQGMVLLTLLACEREADPDREASVTDDGPQRGAAVDPGWLLVDAPGPWEEAGRDDLADHDGFAWYRTFVRVPQSWRGRSLTLSLGSLDDADETFFNGVLVGAHGAMPPHYVSATAVERAYAIAPNLVRHGGWNLLAIRVYDGGGRGGFKSERIELWADDETLDLAGRWQLRTGDDIAWAAWPRGGAGAARATIDHYVAAAGEHLPGRGGPRRVDPDARERIDRGLPLDPGQALRTFRVKDGYAVEVVACEPDIVQPVEVQFDERGRMWVVQYVQYMYPAGLKPLSKDRWDRTVYDRVPEPPPRGPRGADRITICEDSDGNGRYDTFRDFVTGLNLATSVAIGHGGVFVAQTPYLLFYPDRDQDDVPDADPEVLLEGFGMEDAHAVVNSLTWGPDGWLYGAQGSTCTARVRGHVFQQAAWRYHPKTRDFEVFAEGGGNTFGLEFDRHGNLLTGTNWGGYVLVHYVQGGRYFKNFDKHGPLSNPHSYGYIGHCPHEGEAKGHVAHVGVRYQGGAFGGELDGAWIMPHLLGNRISVHEVLPHGSSFKTRFREQLLITDDKWFRPVDIVTGPDGALYVADWYDRRATHLIPQDTWHKDSGRIYRIARTGTARAAPFDLREKSSSELIDLLSHSNDWYARVARRLLDARDDASAYPRLWELIAGEDPDLALEALWALWVGGGASRERLTELFAHAEPAVRAWAVRLFWDDGSSPSDDLAHAPALLARWKQLVADESDATVRSQIASSLGRASAAVAATGVLDGFGSVYPNDDEDDPHVPLLSWWALERAVTGLLAEDPPSLQRWAAGDRNSPLYRTELRPRLVRRLIADASDAGRASDAALEAAVAAIGTVESWEESVRVLEAVARALASRVLEDPPAALARACEAVPEDAGGRVAVLKLRVGLALGGSTAARERALQVATDPESEDALRVECIEALAAIDGDTRVPRVLVAVARGDGPEPVRLAALRGLGAFDAADIAAELLDACTTLPSAALRDTALGVLAQRPPWAMALADAVESGRIETARVPLHVVQAMRAHADADGELARLLDRHWPEPRPSPAAVQQRIAALKTLLTSERGRRVDAAGIARGRETFRALCSACHRLHGEGSELGPDLTGYERDNLDAMLVAIVDPHAAIREGYRDWVLEVQDGSKLFGTVTERAATAVTIRDVTRGPTTVAADRIRQLEPTRRSRMPAGLLDGLDDRAINELFAYVATDG